MVLGLATYTPTGCKLQDDQGDEEASREKSSKESGVEGERERNRKTEQANKGYDATLDMSETKQT